MDKDLPCINCLMLPICRVKYLDNNTKNKTRLMKARLTINKCKPAVDYLYVHTDTVIHVNHQEEIEPKVVRVYDRQRAQRIVDNFENPI